jgi:hypothetical protein
LIWTESMSNKDYFSLFMDFRESLTRALRYSGLNTMYPQTMGSWTTDILLSRNRSAVGLSSTVCALVLPLDFPLGSAGTESVLAHHIHHSWHLLNRCRLAGLRFIYMKMNRTWTRGLVRGYSNATKAQIFDFLISFPPFAPRSSRCAEIYVNLLFYYKRTIFHSRWRYPDCSWDNAWDRVKCIFSIRSSAVRPIAISNTTRNDRFAFCGYL